jgi:NAD(P)-dependent dehydrogenase (short-subunit alcohol dehydrogenase family)
MHPTRIGESREVATAIAFLLSDDACYIVGAHLAVDGGFLD